MTDIWNILKEEAQKRGDRLAAIPVDRLADVKREFDEMGVDTEPYYRFEPDEDFGFEARSVLVVASPNRGVSASFTVNGEKRSVIVPAAYANFDKKYAEIEKYISDVLRKNGLSAAKTRDLPCKPIAARSGLAVYGRNNVTYIDGMGSYFNLFLFYSDAECGAECFRAPLRSKKCDDCALCAERCPASAISGESLLIDANRCLASFNEHGGEFPDWIKPEWHNALVGCVKCQRLCPMNAVFGSDYDEIAAFDEEETRDFLDGKLPDEAFARLGIGMYKKVLPRNLSVLLRKQ